MTDADPEAVRSEFAGSTPPSLALQWFLAERFREAALAAQGYVVVERDVGLAR